MKKNEIKKKRKMSKKKKIIIFILILLVAVGLVFFALNIGKNNEQEQKKKVVDQIKTFDYSVVETDTELFKEKFKKLKDELSKKEIDNKKYASLISELFIIDFYTLSNKTNINDVGGVQFVYSSFKSDFIDFAREGIYKQVKSNLDNDRYQDLPEVKDTNIENIDEIIPSTELKHEDFKNITEKEAYKVQISWDYTKSNDFQNSATMIIVKDNDKFSVAKLEE